MKTDAKIDMLHQSGLFGSPSKKTVRYGVNDGTSDEEDIEASIV
jgi:kinesin family protein 20